MALRTPVALFIFNRPEVTARVFAAIRAVRPERLLIVADGPRADAAEAELCARVRATVATVDWECDVTHLYSDENLGCGRRVSSGLDWVFAQAEEAILLEDDCLPDPTFFPMCEALLERYREDERVAMIAGTNYFPDTSRAQSYFFTRYFPIWGWASWRRAWQGYDYTMSAWPAARDSGALGGLFMSDGLARYLTKMFDSAYDGQVDTWDIQWMFSCLAQGRLCTIPKHNLITNIGFHGTREAGENVGMSTQPMPAGELAHPETFLADQRHERRLFEEKLRGPRHQVLRYEALTRLSRLRRAL